MSLYDTIYKLAKQRQWGINDDFLKGSGENSFVIGRKGIKRYSVELEKLSSKGIHKKRAYKILDTQMVDIIKKHIPQTKNYTFIFYSTQTGYFTETSKVGITKNIVK